MTCAISTTPFIRRLSESLSHQSKAVVKLNLLRLTRIVCDNHPDRATLVSRFDLAKIVDRLVHQDEAILVRQLAKEIYPTLIFGAPDLATSVKSASALSTLAPDHTPLSAAPASISTDPRVPHSELGSKSRVLSTMRRATSDNGVLPSALTDTKPLTETASTPTPSSTKNREKSASGLGQVTMMPSKTEGGEEKGKHKRKISRSQLR